MVSMTFLTAILFILAVFVALAWLAVAYGAESRSGFDERPEGMRFGALR